MLLPSPLVGDGLCCLFLCLSIPSPSGRGLEPAPDSTRGRGCPAVVNQPEKFEPRHFPNRHAVLMFAYPVLSHGNVRAIHLTSPMISVSGVHARGG